MPWSRRTGCGLSANHFRQLSEAEIQSSIPDAIEQRALFAEINIWRAIDAQVRQVERWVLDELKSSATLKALRSTPGIGSVLGMTIELETGEISRFDDVGDYVSYCRMVESKRISNGKQKGRGNAKCGNRYLCWAYIEAANFAVRHCEEARRWCDRKTAKSKLRVVAIKAVAHKLARSSYYLMRDGGVFDAKRTFG